MSTTQAATTDSATQKGTGKQRIIVVLAATVATVVVWLLAHSAFGVDLKAKTGGTKSSAVTLPAVIVVTLLIGLLAWGLLALLERKSASAGKTWTIIAGIVFVISLLGPAGGVGTGAKLSLLCIHLAAGLIIIPGLSRTARKG